MGNVTKAHREKILKSLNELRRYLLSVPSPATVIRCLDEIEAEFEQDNYGLVFEEHEEQIESLMERRTIRLEELVDLRLGEGARENWLIEGENLAALSTLEEIFAGKVDVICIDPPYNTGMQDLTYGDHEYSDEEDAFCHSKWLSFMNKRLRASRTLLSDNGVLFVHVDENEIGTLLMLCGNLFNEENISVLVWPKTDTRFDQNRIERPFRNIKIVHEYVIVCFKDIALTKFNKILVPIFKDQEWQSQFCDMESILKGLGTTSSAKDELAHIFGDRNRFRTPKPMRLIKEFIRAASKKDSIIMDFFAGSGTTGHAVMDLNREDNGERIFILINSNENFICREITYERLKLNMVEHGYNECLAYYQIKFGDGSSE